MGIRLVNGVIVNDDDKSGAGRSTKTFSTSPSSSTPLQRPKFDDMPSMRKRLELQQKKSGDPNQKQQGEEEKPKPIDTMDYLSTLLGIQGKAIHFPPTSPVVTIPYIYIVLLVVLCLLFGWKLAVS